ncbi:MAG: type II secretion system protein [Planctomycetia bacterium]|nr:type II secretion system protein [Planctomycetia bacterium]
MSRAFTLVEILIVVILLGILAAIVIPQITGFTETARQAALRQNLRNIRSRLEAYFHQHNSTNPTVEDFTDQMLKFSDAAGNVSDSFTPQYYLGPYLEQMPANAYTGIATVRVIDEPATFFTPPETSGGWWFNRATREFRADLSADVTDEDGNPLWKW